VLCTLSDGVSAFWRFRVFLMRRYTIYEGEGVRSWDSMRRSSGFGEAVGDDTLRNPWVSGRSVAGKVPWLFASTVMYTISKI
jgi:hypothetical protein